MDKGTCTLSGCGKPIKRAGFCYGHYMKNWRYGTPEPEFESRRTRLEGRVFGRLTVVRPAGRQWLCVCDCGVETTVRTGDLNRGTVASCGAHGRRDDAGYGAAHDRVRADRGRAEDYQCTDCGGAARHWSYNHSDPDERHSDKPRHYGAAYSLDPAHYSPRCVPCHKRFDLDRRDARIPA